MLALSRSLVPAALCLSALFCFVMGVTGSVAALGPYDPRRPVLGSALFFMAMGHAVYVWEDVPLTGVCLGVAMMGGLRCTLDIVVVGTVAMVVAFIWSLGWTFAFLGAYDRYTYLPSFSGGGGGGGGDHGDVVYTMGTTGTDMGTTKSTGGNGMMSCWGGVVLALGMLVSYLWTLNIIKVNIVVTVAVVGAIAIAIAFTANTGM